MKLTGLHLLLTYRCTYECDHCFVWGSPWQSGVMTLAQIQEIVRQAQTVDSVDSIYFEGGEPFLYYATLLKGVTAAAEAGFSVGIVSNAYWATSVPDALEALRPFAGLVDDLSLSCDLYHSTNIPSLEVQNAQDAAARLGISSDVLSVALPEQPGAALPQGQLLPGQSAVMYRGRAADKLVSRTGRVSWTNFNRCPHENLREPGRVHVDPFGDLHLCQGVVIGRMFRTSPFQSPLYRSPLHEICETYQPETHPIVGPLLAGGPAELVSRYNVRHRESYADACHLCYEARTSLRARFPEVLKPGQMYGILEASG